MNSDEQVAREGRLQRTERGQRAGCEAQGWADEVDLTHHEGLAAGGLAGRPGSGGGAGEEGRRQRRGRREEGVRKVMNKWAEGRGKTTEGQRTG